MSKALELANEYLWDDDHCVKAAEELRRLAEVEAELNEELEAEREETKRWLVKFQNERDARKAVEEELQALKLAISESVPIGYLYHDARSAELANPLIHSVLLTVADSRMPHCRNETPLYTLKGIK